MKSKICGLTSLEVAKRIIVLKPDAIGIYCWPETGRGDNSTTKEIARDVVQLATSASIQSFYLTYTVTAKEAYEDCALIGNTHIQIIGDMPLTEIAQLKELLPELQTVKVIGVTGPESLDEARMYAASSAVDQLLLDSRSTAGARGGTGKTHDWNISRKIVEECTKPVWLAGGIRLHNVKDAINTVRPYGIDVETGVQTPDGTKDYEAIERFIVTVRDFS